MSQAYAAELQPAWRHPKDHPPPLGTKLLLYMYPYGVTIIGEWNSGAKLWAPLPSVPREMKLRLEQEYGSASRSSK